MRIDPSGTIYVATGACAQGQGHETVFAQVAADAWGVTPDQVTVVVSDTARSRWATAPSQAAARSIPLPRFDRRARSCATRFAVAGHVLECDVEDLELRDGRVAVRGVPRYEHELKEVAQSARPGWDHGRPDGMAPGLETTVLFRAADRHLVLCGACRNRRNRSRHGRATIHKYVVVHDAGVLINPKLAEGQILGGVCQGLGGGLLEEIVFDGQAQFSPGRSRIISFPPLQTCRLSRSCTARSPSP